MIEDDSQFRETGNFQMKDQSTALKIERKEEDGITSGSAFVPNVNVFKKGSTSLQPNPNVTFSKQNDDPNQNTAEFSTAFKIPLKVKIERDGNRTARLRSYKLSQQSIKPSDLIDKREQKEQTQLSGNFEISSSNMNATQSNNTSTNKGILFQGLPENLKNRVLMQQTHSSTNFKHYLNEKYQKKQMLDTGAILNQNKKNLAKIHKDQKDMFDKIRQQDQYPKPIGMHKKQSKSMASLMPINTKKQLSGINSSQQSPKQFLPYFDKEEGGEVEPAFQQRPTLIIKNLKEKAAQDFQNLNLRRQQSIIKQNWELEPLQSDHSKIQESMVNSLKSFQEEQLNMLQGYGVDDTQEGNAAEKHQKGNDINYQKKRMEQLLKARMDSKVYNEALPLMIQRNSRSSIKSTSSDDKKIIQQQIAKRGSVLGSLVQLQNLKGTEKLVNIEQLKSYITLSWIQTQQQQISHQMSKLESKLESEYDEQFKQICMKMIYLADIAVKEIIVHQTDTKYTDYAKLLQEAQNTYNTFYPKIINRISNSQQSATNTNDNEQNKGISDKDIQKLEKQIKDLNNQIKFENLNNKKLEERVDRLNQQNKKANNNVTLLHMKENKLTDEIAKLKLEIYIQKEKKKFYKKYCQTLIDYNKKKPYSCDNSFDSASSFNTFNEIKNSSRNYRKKKRYKRRDKERSDFSGGSDQESRKQLTRKKKATSEKEEKEQMNQTREIKRKQLESDMNEFINKTEDEQKTKTMKYLKGDLQQNNKPAINIANIDSESNSSFHYSMKTLNYLDSSSSSLDSQGEIKESLINIGEDGQLVEDINIDLESVEDLVGENNQFLDAIQEEGEDGQAANLPGFNDKGMQQKIINKLNSNKQQTLRAVNEKIKLQIALRDRIFIEQNKFTVSFMQELQINNYFDQIQKYVQEIILNDEFILNIIIEGAKQKNDKKLIGKQKQLKQLKFQGTATNAIVYNISKEFLNHGADERGKSRGKGGARSKSPEKDSQNFSSRASLNLSSVRKNENKEMPRKSFNPLTNAKPRGGIINPFQKIQSAGKTINFLNQVTKTKNQKMIQSDTLFVLRSENLYEIIFAILGELFFRKGDIMSGLIVQLQRRFGKEYYKRFFGINSDNFESEIPVFRKSYNFKGKNKDVMAKQITDQMRENSKNAAAQEYDNQIPHAKKEESSAGSKMQRRGTLSYIIDTPRQSVFKRGSTTRDVAYLLDRILNQPGKNRDNLITKEDKETQTGDSLESILQMTSIGGLNPLNLFVPGESDQFDKASGLRKFVQLNDIDQQSKKVMKVKIYYSKNPNFKRSRHIEESGYNSTQSRQLVISSAQRLQEEINETPVNKSPQIEQLAPDSSMMNKMQNNLWKEYHKINRPQVSQTKEYYDKILHVEIEEYLPRKVVEQFLPFDCAMKENFGSAKANIFEYQALKNRPKQHQIYNPLQQQQQWIFQPPKQLTRRMSIIMPSISKSPSRDRGGSSNKKPQRRSSSILQFSRKSIVDRKAEQEYKYNNLQEMVKNLNPQEFLQEYHKLLNDAASSFKTKQIDLQFLRMQALVAKDSRIKNSFSLLPAFHQTIIKQVIDQSVQQKLQDQYQAFQDKQTRIEELYKYELQLERLNQKVQSTENFIQELQVKRNIWMNQGIQKSFKEIQNSDNLQAILKSCGALNQAHTDGFNLGLAHGKFLNKEIERNMILSQGQMNGAKHGWLSGFEIGQIYGIKKVFVECYLSNINLFEKLNNLNKSTALLDQFELAELRQEKLNEYHKTFKQISINSNRIQQLKNILAYFKKMDTSQKLEFKTINKKTCLNYIFHIYKEYKILQEKHSKENDAPTLTEAILQQIPLNYGSTGITNQRIIRLYSSIYFNIVEQDEREELEEGMFRRQLTDTVNQQIQDFNQKFNTKEYFKKNFRAMQLKQMDVNYALLHFAKFCQISDNINNLSNEVLEFYMKIYNMVNEIVVIQNRKRVSMKHAAHKESECEEKTSKVQKVINLSQAHQVDVIILWRVLEVMKLHLQPILPESIYPIFRKNVETNLRIHEDENKHEITWIDRDRFLDQSILMYLRFNYKQLSEVSKLFYAWTLFTVDEIDFDQVYLLLKIFLSKAFPLVEFHYKDKNQTVQKKMSEVMQQIHNKFGVSQVGFKQKSELQMKMSAVGGFADSALKKEETRTIQQNPFQKSLEELNEKELQNEEIKEKISQMHTYENKIIKNNQRLMSRYNCSLNHSQFIQIFGVSNIAKTKNAQTVYDKIKAQKDGHEITKLVNEDFMKQCRVRILDLKLLRSQLVVNLRKTQRYSVIIKEQIQREKEKEMERLEAMKVPSGSGDENERGETPRIRSKNVSRRQSQASKVEDQQESDSEDIEIHNNISNDNLNSDQEQDAGDHNQSINKMSRKEREIIDNLDIDLKPYFCSQTINTWSLRLQRLEQKMNMLHPELVALSLELHEIALNMIATKLNKLTTKENNFRNAVNKRLQNGLKDLNEDINEKMGVEGKKGQQEQWEQQKEYEAKVSKLKNYIKK